MVRVHLLLPKHTQVCFFVAVFVLHHRLSFLKLWGYGEDAIACCNTLGVARTCLARASLLASTKAHASVLFCCRFAFYATDPLFETVGYGEDAIACCNTLGVARTCLARASPLASTKAHASVLFLLLFCILRHRPSFLKLWGFGEDAIACRNTLGVARTCLARASPLASTKAHASVLFVAVLHFTPPTLFFETVGVR